MITIELLDLRFFAFHGYHEGEEKTGNEFQVNLQVKFGERNAEFREISETINYEELFQLVSKRMEASTALLEKVCESIIGLIRHQYPFVTEIDISVYKLQAPIQGFQGKVGVRMNKTFHG